MKVARCLSAFAVLAASASAGAQRPGTYLVSLTGVPVRSHDRVTGFTIRTWAVDILAICTIPQGWRMRAGRFATMEGLIEGESTHGVTWLGGNEFSALRNLVLVRIRFPVVGGTRRHGSGDEIATFLGDAIVEGAGPRWRQVPLTLENIRFSPARSCLPV